MFSYIQSESEVAQLCPTLCDPMDTRLLHPWDFLGKSTGVYWSGLPFPSPGNFRPRDRTQVSHIVADALPSEPLQIMPVWLSLFVFQPVVYDLPLLHTLANVRVIIGLIFRNPVVVKWHLVISFGFC